MGAKNPGSNGRALFSNAMTVDVEDYFQVHAFNDHIARNTWETIDSRLAEGVDACLEVFEERHIKATFFILGWSAERYPQVVRSISDAGHEIASHGWEHIRVDAQTPEEFRQDCKRTKQRLEDLTGRDVKGYRAASFSIGPKTPWAHQVLKEAGYSYSSSIYPIRHDHYGAPGSPRFPYYPAGPDGVVELPITTSRLAGLQIPCGGGGYFRLLPRARTSWAITQVNKTEGMPSIFYFHSWELDPRQPFQKKATALARFRHYHNLSRQKERLTPLLQDFLWDRTDKAFAAFIGPED